MYQTSNDVEFITGSTSNDVDTSRDVETINGNCSLSAGKAHSLSPGLCPCPYPSLSLSLKGWD